MFDEALAQLDEVLRDVDVPVDADALAAYFARLDRLAARGAVALGRFAANGGPQRDGAVTLKSWLMHRLGRDRTSATHLAAQAIKLHRLPVLRAAFEAGTVGSGAVEMILALVPTRRLDCFADHEAELVPAVAGLDRRDLAAAMQTWLARADALDPGPARRERPDTLYLAATSANRALLQANLGRDLATVVAAALRAADSGDLNVPVPQRQAQSLGQVALVYLDHLTAPARAIASRNRPHVNVTMTGDQWADSAGAPPARDVETDLALTPAGTGVLRCDAIVHALVHDGTVSCCATGGGRGRGPGRW